MKRKVKIYGANVQTARDSAFVVCVCYNLDVAETFVGVEYYELMTSFENKGLSIPSNRQATFREELRVLQQAASTYKGGRKAEKRHIESKLKEAYGGEITVNFTDIQQKPVQPKTV